MYAMSSFLLEKAQLETLILMYRSSDTAKTHVMAVAHWS